MKYHPLGRTGLRVSQLSLGTMTFGDDWGWGASAEESTAVLNAYLDAGGNFVDTANVYTGGSAERILGAALQGRRDEVVLSTKFNAPRRAGDVNAAGNHRKNLVSSLEESLTRLRTDYVDVYWVHARDTFTPVAEVMRALDDQVRAGKVRYVGVSDWPAWEIAQANTLAELRGWTPFAGLQLRYNLLERSPELDLLPMAGTFDIGVLAWGPLAEGRLTGKYLSGEGGRLDVYDWGGEGDEETAKRVVAEVVAVAQEVGRSPAQVALAWLRDRGPGVIPIVGVTRRSQLADNLASLELRLDNDQVRRLDKVSEPRGTFPHNFVRTPQITEVVYGDRWRDIEDRRRASRRTVNDVL